MRVEWSRRGRAYPSTAILGAKAGGDEKALVYMTNQPSLDTEPATRRRT